MAHTKITPQISGVGVLNPNMRVFDIIMKTEYGTSYNAYLVRGCEKTALIDTVHKDYIDYLFANIKEVAPDVTIDYLIMNHNEPDHSGGIAELLDYYPNMKILSSKTGSVFLKDIINRDDYVIETVSDGDTLDLGGTTLRFVHAPFLHWADSMFTYVEQDKVLFSCDFLGAHYCEPQGYDHTVVYQKEFEHAFLGYYEAIFSPFQKHVRNGLDQMKKLDVEIVAPSHGPILTKGCFLEKAVSRYESWSTPVVREERVIPIFYCSAYGNTERVANHIAQGIQQVIPDAAIQKYNVIEHDVAKLAKIMNESDAFLLGSPTINRDALPPMHILLAHAEAIGMAKRPVSVFGSYGWSGEACKHLRNRLSDLKTNVYPDDFRVHFIPSEQDLKQAVCHGQAFAQWMLK